METHPDKQDPRVLRELLPPALQQELDGLTDKQADFAVLVAHGIAKEDAYRQAYDVAPTTKENSIRSLSSKIARHKNVSRVIERIQARAMSAGAIPEEVPLTREWVLKRLGEEVENRKNSGNVRVRALELIGKTQGMFEDVQVIRDERPTTAEEAERQIMAIIGEVVTGRRSLPATPQAALPAHVEPDDDDGT